MTSQVLKAFTEEQTARLARLSVSRLVYWDRTGFFRPSFGDENRRLKYSRNYSFRDVVGLRTLSMLINEHGIPVRYLRKVKDCLQRPQEFWADTVIYILGKKVYFEEPNIDTFREPTSGQLSLKNIPLRRVIGEVENEVLQLRRRDNSSFGKVSRDKFVVRNSLVIDGTRVPVNTIKVYFDEGYTQEQIKREFPSLTDEDIEAAKMHLGIGAA
ncbi:MAG: DUF433 domain-containing protein [Gemmobacter sp.]